MPCKKLIILTSKQSVKNYPRRYKKSKNKVKSGLIIIDVYFLFNILHDFKLNFIAK